MSKRVLLLGPRYSDANEVGGIVVLFELLLVELARLDVAYICIDTNKRNYGNVFLAYIIILFSLLRNIRTVSHVSLHGTARDYIYIAPITVFLAKLLKKKVSLRKFAGSFAEFYEQTSPISKRLIYYSIRSADACFFETKYLVKYFGVFNSETFWFPNVRAKSDIRRNIEEPFKKRFIFVGQVKVTKGTSDLVSVFKGLPDDYSLHFYGPVESQDFLNSIRPHANIIYKGVIDPSLVPEIMAGYDVFIMPTFHAGEGYPGVIIEAFSAGIPVVSTTVGGISEIVSSGRSGILVEARNLPEIRRAVTSFDDHNYSRFATEARHAFGSFESSAATTQFLGQIGVSA